MVNPAQASSAHFALDFRGLHKTHASAMRLRVPPAGSTSGTRESVSQASQGRKGAGKAYQLPIKACTL